MLWDKQSLKHFMLMKSSFSDNIKGSKIVHLVRKKYYAVTFLQVFSK